MGLPGPQEASTFYKAICSFRNWRGKMAVKNLEYQVQGPLRVKGAEMFRLILTVNMAYCTVCAVKLGAAQSLLSSDSMLSHARHNTTLLSLLNCLVKIVLLVLLCSIFLLLLPFLLFFSFISCHLTVLSTLSPLRAESISRRRDSHRLHHTG